MPTIHYTHTDEAPALATYAFLPVVSGFAKHAGIDVESPDISLAGRILATFSDQLASHQKVPDALAMLGELAKTSDANIIKLPNISASVPQLKTAIAELQAKGFGIPDYPEDPETDAEREAQRRYNGIKGSAVNPVLREGNSDRRAPKAVKEYARNHPHSMGTWSADTKSHVSTMTGGDFRHTEVSVTVPAATTARIVHTAADGTEAVLMASLPLEAAEVLDASVMRKSALLAFLDAEIKDANSQNILFSLHMKATMMKVSDPIIFGHAVRVFFADLFAKYAEVFDEIGVDVNNGFGDLLSRLADLPDSQRASIEAEIAKALESGPDLAMVDSDKGITNLHVPSDVIIDASMPAMIRTSGSMWNTAGKLQETKAVIPDSSYAGIYEAVFTDCKAHGALDPTTMGSVSNVGLMAKKAEEYGSHNKTFEVSAAGTITVQDAEGTVLTTHDVETGDIWRACQTKDAPILDWIGLAVRRARESGTPAIFWLDEDRAHDAELITKINAALLTHNTDGLDIRIMDPKAACHASLDRARAGDDTISVTGNVLRDYNTDLFPILEVGTSAKMLSIVPLMNGGGLFETGAGGSAPKHVQQFNAENHLRWDSLGEFLALAVSFQHISGKYANTKAKILGETLDDATTQYLLDNKSPSRKVNQPDNRSSQYWLTRYWATKLSEQDEDAELKATFAPVAEALAKGESAITAELIRCQGPGIDLDGYYAPNAKKARSAMRPSPTLNKIVNAL
ncbi:MAG: isocitrate dehydrogenase [Myxococcota bacterium]|jgi:isocitrate dehydrogenase